MTDNDADADVDRLLLIVVGAHIQAERTDRPLGYRLREAILHWMDEEPETLERLDPVVCSDLWYLNNDDLLERPTIALGGPGVNAATAFFANRLPIAFVIESTLQVHLDVAFNDRWACLWGADHPATASAVDLFAERYLDGFLRAAHGMPGGT